MKPVHFFRIHRKDLVIGISKAFLLFSWLIIFRGPLISAQTYSMNEMNQKDTQQPPFSGPTRVSSLKELEDWAKTALGGGTLRTFGNFDQKLYVVDRNLLSGQISSEISIYSKCKNDFCLVFHISVQTGFYHRFVIRGDTLAIIRGDMKRNEIEIGTLSFSAFKDL